MPLSLRTSCRLKPELRTLEGAFPELSRPIERWNNDELSVSNRRWAVNYDEEASVFVGGDVGRVRG